MKCPHCGHWNKGSLTRCFSCGEPLAQNNESKKAPEWAAKLKEAQVDKQYLRYDDTLPDVEDVPQVTYDENDAAQNPQEELVDTLDELNARRRRGNEYLQEMRRRAREAQEAIASVPVIRPLPEEEDDYLPDSPFYDEDDAADFGDPLPPSATAHIVDPFASAAEKAAPASVSKTNAEESSRRSRRRAAAPPLPINATPTTNARDINAGKRTIPVKTDPYSDPEIHPQYVFDDEDPNAPILYDGYERPLNENEVGAYTDYAFPRINDEGYATRNNYSDFYPGNRGNTYVARRKRSMLPRIVAFTVLGFALLIGAYFGYTFVSGQLSSGLVGNTQTQAQVTIEEREVNGLPGHVVTIASKEGAQIYVRELQSSYIITGGVAAIEIADYTWYEHLEEITTPTMDVTLTPFLKLSEGEQIALTPITYTVDIPLSPVTLVKPQSAYASVGTSIFEIKLNVEKGSKVIIDGANVSSLITTNGYVSKNVQVLPTGENKFQISVRSQYCRDNNMEVVLYRAPQEIPLELDGDTESESTAKTQSMTIYGTTLPGATVTIESTHTGLAVAGITATATPDADLGFVAPTATPAPTGKPELDGINSITTDETGKFVFTSVFDTIGDNTITIRASYPGKTDSVITHTVSWIPDIDVYSRKAWGLGESDYTELINNINNRKGQIYVTTGTVTRVVSESPQLVIMNTNMNGGEQLILLENSSKTIWEVGKVYRIYGDVFGLYDTMPRLTARYTYAVETETPIPEQAATPAP